MAGTSLTRERRIADESIRLFFEAIARERFQVYIPTIGAILIGFVAWKNGGVPLGRILGWVAFVGGAETALNAFDRRFLQFTPPEEAFRTWAWRKTAILAVLGVALGLGPILMNAPGVPISTMFSSWAILIFDAALVYACAGFAPSLVITMAAATAPPMLWLFFTGDELERVAAICLFSAFPFTLAFGTFAARNLRSLVIGRIEIADLLERERELVVKVRDAQADRSRFYSAASHDLRQPLHALGFYLSLLSSASDPDKRREIEARLEECIGGLDRQFNAIIGMAQADHALEKATPRPAPLARLLERVVVRGAAQAAAAGLDLRLARSSLWALVDEDLLERVIVNLVVNALRYTERGGVLLGVRRAGESLRICVVDTGIGVETHEIDKIFEDFYQVGNPERNRDKGFGLGLAIVRRLCAAMNWRIEVRSRPGRGSVFSVTVPRTAPSAMTADAPAEAPTPARDVPEGLVVMVVDDDDLVRDATTRMLQKWGIRAEPCRDGAEAVAALARRADGETWHALLDQRLANGETGLALARTLLAGPPPAPRMSLITGDIDESVMAAARALGLEVLRKPVKALQLRALLGSRAPVRASISVESVETDVA
jgi:signal transduction histidine kinase/CheY-like chemotaxis protein